MSFPMPRGKRSALRVALILALFGAAARAGEAPTASVAERVVVTSTVTLLESPHESLPVRLATQDLQDDFARVFGVRPRIVTSREETGPVTIMIGEEARIPADMLPPRVAASQPESFSISVHRADSSPGVRAVVLTGPDIRGTLYAIYQYTQDYLGV